MMLQNNFKPKYPIYIVSKGRASSMLTSKALREMKQFHYIIIEPQDLEPYTEALEKFDLKNFVELIVAPFSNHGDGPGRARNYAWDHAISMNSGSHWVLDDNIFDFYRLHKNQKIRVSTSAIFRAAEDFVDRYENVPVSGFNYLFFVAQNEKNPAFIFNTRIYSTLLIRNDCKHRWRGRYNEDTDLSLRVLKDGDCTIQFNAFLQDKAATQTIKGGNTEEFYHKEGSLEKEKWRDGFLNPEGTIKKSQMLFDMHPDVTSIVFKFGRWHHHVDYSGFRYNTLRFKPGIEIPEGINEYGMKYITNYDYDGKYIKRA